MNGLTDSLTDRWNGMLPVNFHKTFIPERHLIAALLDYSALGKSGSLHEIAAATGIPMGKTNGKVPAIIDYAIGMGLITLYPGGEKGVRIPQLTSFGKSVFLEDKFLGEEITQWIAHMNLCRPDIGAKAWYKTFNEGRDIIGGSFTFDQLEDYLVSIFRPGKDRTGPMLRAYWEDAALARTKVIEKKGEVISRTKAPLYDAFALSYSAYILDLLETFFPNQSQVTLSDFQGKTGWFNVCLWQENDIEKACSLMEETRHLSIDRQRRPWIIEKSRNAEEVWPCIWDDL
ncbi:MAG TPA: hypothetical protein VFC73_06260 [Syntrophomonadaceae bacterium]|nr:hypothetical protein [Syntrophomonadaceae bacterium]